MPNRTPLARFIDRSALWSLCLIIWFAFLFYRLGRIYLALPLAFCCAAATIALILLIKSRLRRRRADSGLSAEEIHSLCGWLALCNTRDALCQMVGWLEFCGKYSGCRIRSGVICARKTGCTEPDKLRIIALVARWTDEQISCGDVAAVWRQTCILRRRMPRARMIIAGTCDMSPAALALCRRLDIAFIAPPALSALMLRALPLCRLAAAPTRRVSAVFKTVIRRANAGRFAAYALGLCIAGRVPGLPYCRAVGLVCALLWILCAAQAREHTSDKWI